MEEWKEAPPSMEDEELSIHGGNHVPVEEQLPSIEKVEEALPP